MSIVRWLAPCGLSLLALQANAQRPESETIVERMGTAVLTQASGGTVGISKGLAVVSRNSSLTLQWLMVNDSTLGIIFDGPVGAQGVYEEPWFRYSANMKMHALTFVAAFEVRIVTFDIWGDFTGTLSFTQLENMSPEQRKAFPRVWGIYGESQLRSHFTSVAYIANVRLTDGKTIAADPSLVLKAAQAIKKSITLQDLTPKAEPIPLMGGQKT